MSAINTNGLDVNYPVPGVNNNSQGFRDNFASIKTNLSGIRFLYVIRTIRRACPKKNNTQGNQYDFLHSLFLFILIKAKLQKDFFIFKQKVIFYPFFSKLIILQPVPR